MPSRPAPASSYRVGNQYAASCLIKVRVEGKQVHASTPWLGVDPYPAAAAIIGATGQLYRQVSADTAITVSFGHVEDVGRFNIIGQTVTLWGTIRCLDESAMGTVQENLRRLAEGQAAAYGVQATVEYKQDVPALTNTAEWFAALRPSIERVIGTERLREIPGGMGYDDMSVFVNAFGGGYFNFGVQDTTLANNTLAPVEGGRGLAMNHNPGFYADDVVLVDSLRIHAHVAYDHLIGEATV